MNDDKFIAAVKRMEQRTRKIGAFVVVDPADTSRHGRVTLSYPREGERVSVVAWLPGEPKVNGVYPLLRHHGNVRGGGYDKATAAMGGAQFWNLKTRTICKMESEGQRWKEQLEAAGYAVFHGC